MEFQLNCLIIDDEPLARIGLADYADKIDFITVVGQCSTALEATTFLQNGSVDLIFLDINLPYLSGLDFLKSLEKPPLVILTTAYSEYALEGYQLQVVDYLLKPISFQRYYQAVLKAKQLHEAVVGTAQNNVVDPFLYIRQGDGFQKISWPEIRYIEGMQNYVKLHFKDQVLVIHQTVLSLVDKLPKEHFFRIHKSYVVNISHIESINGNRLFVSGQQLPISRTYRESLLQDVVYKKLLSK